MRTLPTFANPKKIDTIYVINGFRELNKMIEGKPCSVPNIQESVTSISQFRIAICINLLIRFYSIQLSYVSKELYTIVLPWGKWKY